MIHFITLIVFSIFIIETCSIKVAVLPDEKFLVFKNNKINRHSKYFNTDNLIVEQIDDEHIKVSGYIRCIRGMDRSKMLHLVGRTKYFEKGQWIEGGISLTLLDLCTELLNPLRFWYNITKLIGANKCPPQTGDILPVETQILNIVIDMPSPIPIAPWRYYAIVSQGLPPVQEDLLIFGHQFELYPV